jgi:cytochrome c
MAREKETRRTGAGMLDTMTFTKVLGALCGSLLVFMLVGTVSAALFYPGGHGDHGEQAFRIDTGAEEPAAVAEDAPDFETLYAAADAGAGERLWRQCAACHALEPGKNGTGPSLYGVVGRAKHAIDGFNYSNAALAVEGVWTPENIDAFIANPRGYMPGTAMSYAGMRKPEDRANLIAYLDSVDN